MPRQTVDHTLECGEHIQVSHGESLLSLVFTTRENDAAILLTRNEVMDLVIDLLNQGLDLKED